MCENNGTIEKYSLSSSTNPYKSCSKLHYPLTLFRTENKYTFPTTENNPRTTKKRRIIFFPYKQVFSLVLDKNTVFPI